MWRKHETRHDGRFWPYKDTQPRYQDEICLSRSKVKVKVSYNAKSRSFPEKPQNTSCEVSKWMVGYAHSTSSFKFWKFQSRSKVSAKLGQRSCLHDEIHEWPSKHVMHGIKLKDPTQAIHSSYWTSTSAEIGQGSQQKKVKRSFPSTYKVSMNPSLNMSYVASK